STSAAQSPASPAVPPAMRAPTPAASPSAETVAQSGSAVGDVMLQFQQLMNQFLETQRDVMLTYLQGPPESTMQTGVTLPALAPELLTGTHIDAAPPPWPVSVNDATETSEPASPDTATALPDKAQLTQQLLRIISERTGYPPQMLDLDVDIEADLGI